MLTSFILQETIQWKAGCCLVKAIGKSGEVVINLTKNLAKGSAYFDNYFSSPELLAELHRLNIHANSTLCADRKRKFPLKSKKKLRSRVEAHITTEWSKMMEFLYGSAMTRKWCSWLQILIVFTPHLRYKDIIEGKRSMLMCNVLNCSKVIMSAWVELTNVICF